jgi:hypothetical protein
VYGLYFEGDKVLRAEGDIVPKERAAEKLNEVAGRMGFTIGNFHIENCLKAIEQLPK